MRRTSLLAIMCALALTGCSTKRRKNKKAKANETKVVESKKDTAAEEDILNEEDFIVDDGDELESGPTPVADTAPSEAASSTAGEMGEYTLKKGETLMMAAFNIYGDYSKWKELQDLNSGVSSASLTEGMTLKFVRPAQEFMWSPNGDPYLIQGGDTLGSISSDKYGTDRRWKDLYENNKPLIKDPNLIFAGFTIYYIPDTSVASE